MNRATPGTPLEVDETPSRGPDAVYQALLEQQLLAFQWCPASGDAVFPPRTLCPACGAGNLSWRRSAGVGTVYASTTIAPRGEGPYCVALVDLREGYRMMTNIVGGDPDDVRIGQQVRLLFEQRDGAALPLFSVSAA